MLTKTSIRFLNGKAVRSRWDDKESCWLYAATDIVSAMISTENARRYWSIFKRRHPEVAQRCRQVGLTAADGKRYMTDCLDADGVTMLSLALPAKRRMDFQNWLLGLSDPIDEQSRRRAYELFEGDFVDSIEVGTIRGLRQIHAYLFEGLYDFAGKFRESNISKGGFIFANCQYFKEAFARIESMPDDELYGIVDKYVEMNILHPFMEGNGRSTRIWLDLLLKKRMGLCVDWSQIDKKEYLSAMESSPVDPEPLKSLVIRALTDRIGDRELFMKGIDFSYYYEQVDD